MELKIDPVSFWRLPRHPDWKYEMLKGMGHLSYRPWTLPLQRSTSLPVRLKSRADDRLTVRAVDVSDHAAVAELLVEVWRELDPYRTLHDGTRELDADIARTLQKHPGGVVAVDQAGRIAGAALTVASGGMPVLTFLTVGLWDRHRGVATLMLDAIVRRLAADGETVLLSGASPGNAASVHWHLSRGFSYRPRA